MRLHSAFWRIALCGLALPLAGCMTEQPAVSGVADPLTRRVVASRHRPIMKHHRPASRETATGVSAGVIGGAIAGPAAVGYRPRDFGYRPRYYSYRNRPAPDYYDVIGNRPAPPPMKPQPLLGE